LSAGAAYNLIGPREERLVADGAVGERNCLQGEQIGGDGGESAGDWRGEGEVS
jgi:hypothetical protein